MPLLKPFPAEDLPTKIQTKSREIIIVNKPEEKLQILKQLIEILERKEIKSHLDMEIELKEMGAISYRIFIGLKRE